MFIEKHESAAVGNFNWYDEEGNFIDIEEPRFKIQISNINRYIVEVSFKNIVVPNFINWLFENNYKIYCINDCRYNVSYMTKIQRIFFEKQQAKLNWVEFSESKSIFFKEFKLKNEVEFIWNSFLFCSKINLDRESLEKLFNDFKFTTSRFPNLSFPKQLPKHKDFIIGKVSFGESYFHPVTHEEPVVLVCYSAEKL